MERAYERQRLAAWLADARAGHGRLVLIAGEAGIGKSALVGDLITTLDPSESIVVRCDADGGQPAPVAGGSLVVVIEDVHWADGGTVAAIRRLARHIDRSPLLLVVTYRDNEIDDELRALLRDLTAADGTAWLRPQPLSPGGVEALADRLGSNRSDVHSLSGGNPFLVTELLTAPTGGRFAPPDNVQRSIDERARRLSANARQLLDVVAVVPGVTERWVLAALVDSVDRAVEECLAAGLLTQSTDGCSFRHEIARVAYADLLDPTDRAAVHRKVLDVLVARGGVEPQRMVAHALEAGDTARLGASAAAACSVAAARSAHREAIDYGRIALDAPGALDADDTAELQLTMAAALCACSRDDEAHPLAAAAAAHWDRAGNVDRAARARDREVTCLIGMGEGERAAALAASMVETLDTGTPTVPMAIALARMTSLHMLARRPDEATSWGDRAVAMAEALGDRSLADRVRIDAGIAAVMAGRVEALSVVRAAIESADRRDAHGIVALGWVQIGSGCGEVRDYSTAMPALRTCITVAESYGNDGQGRYAHAWLGRCLFDMGQWDEAEVHVRIALEGPTGAVITRIVALTTLGWLRARRGDGDVWEPLDEALALARRTGHLQRVWPVAVARCEAAWLEGRADDERDLVREAFALASSLGYPQAIAELAVWLRRLGEPVDVDPTSSPFGAWAGGQHMLAVASFRSMGCPYEAAMVEADVGDAVSLLGAFATASRLGAAPLARLLQHRLADRGEVRAVVEPEPEPTTLTSREVDVLRLVAVGFTNPQIGAALFISRKTAEHHVSSILMKLGLTSRSQAAAAAVRLGVVEG